MMQQNSLSYALDENILEVVELEQNVLARWNRYRMIDRPMVLPMISVRMFDVVQHWNKGNYWLCEFQVHISVAMVLKVLLAVVLVDY